MMPSPAGGHPPQQQQYYGAPTGGSYPPQQQMAPGPGSTPSYPPQGAAPAYPQAYLPQAAAPGYPPAAAQQAAGHPPSQQAGYPPSQQAGYPPASYPPQQQQQAYPDAAPAPQQAGYYGAAPPAAPATAYPQQAAGPAAALLPRLQKIVQTNSLQRFYPPQQLEAVAQRLARVDFGALAARWRMPLELALDFTALALYDIVLYADDSGSMAFEVWLAVCAVAGLVQGTGRGRMRGGGYWWLLLAWCCLSSPNPTANQRLHSVDRVYSLSIEYISTVYPTYIQEGGERIEDLKLILGRVAEVGGGAGGVRGGVV